MKKLFFFACLSATMAVTSCDEIVDFDQFDYDTPSGESQAFTADPSTIDAANTSIAKLKSEYYSYTSSSSFKEVTDDKIFEGVVAANDISGNLYQTLIVRDGDTAVVVAINDYSLWAHFPVGTRIRMNMNGLYMGGYGKMPKIGTPYYTSSGNLRQGAMLKQQVATNIAIIGQDAEAYETQPVVINESWLKTADKDAWGPMLVRLNNVEIRGFVNTNTKKRSGVYAHPDDEDAGYGVNDTIIVGNTKLLFRTSTSCSFAFDSIPSGKVDVIGVMTRYTSSWQLQLRDIDDVIIK